VHVAEVPVVPGDEQAKSVAVPVCRLSDVLYEAAAHAATQPDVLRAHIIVLIDMYVKVITDHNWTLV